MLWHYTVGEHWLSINSSGVLRPTSVNVRAAERPAVWFTSRETWEPTATQGFIDGRGVRRTATVEEMQTVGLGMWRIGVAPDVAPLTWADHVRMSGISKNEARALERVARRQGSDPDAWRTTFDPVPRQSWAAVEKFVGGEWRSAKF